MTELKEILEKATIRRALIVDDAFDEVPLASDLAALEADEWTHFFEDVTDEDGTLLFEIFAGYKELRADQLQESDQFVEALWNNRGRIRQELIEPLFKRYLDDASTDKDYLTKLVERLTDFGLTCDKVGRQFQAKAADADIVVIDLFLGTEQNPSAMELTVDRLVQVIRTRSARPPLVVLMSRSSRLEEKRLEFRDRSGLFESAFRILRKAEIADPGRLERVLIRLASHYSESLKLAAFLDAWQSGLKDAGERTASLIRTLDLSDHAQIHQLLLSVEGEPTGSYLVDVFDRVLQHEIEREAGLIDTAIDLNTLTTEAYPPPYIAGSPDLQNLVCRSLFQNAERLRLRGAEGSRVAFGDLLRRKNSGADAQDIPFTALPDIGLSDILVILTPACDLQRQSAKRILLLVGTLRSLGPTDWIYEDDPIRTPVIELPDGSRSWIKWNLKHIETLSHDELEKALDNPAGVEIIARLRESHALELQQSLLSNLGRVGQIAMMPGTFGMRVEAYLPDLQKKLVIPILPATDGVCFVGRSGPKEMRLTLQEDACEAICHAIETLDLKDVHPSARPAVEYLQTTEELMQALAKGITLPSFNTEQIKNVPSHSGQLDAPGEKAKVRTIGWISRNKNVNDIKLSNAEIGKAGFLLATWDHSIVTEVKS